jgi:hypothetical protein
MRWSSIFGRVASLYFFAALIFAAYWLANFFTKDSRKHSDTPARWPEKLKVYGISLFGILCISLIIAALQGPSEDDPDIPVPRSLSE